MGKFIFTQTEIPGVVVIEPWLPYWCCGYIPA